MWLRNAPAQPIINDLTGRNYVDVTQDMVPGSTYERLGGTERPLAMWPLRFNFGANPSYPRRNFPTAFPGCLLYNCYNGDPLKFVLAARYESGSQVAMSAALESIDTGASLKCTRGSTTWIRRLARCCARGSWWSMTGAGQAGSYLVKQLMIPRHSFNF